MKAAGPYVGAEAVRRFGAAPSDPGEFWTFTGPLPSRVSFAVYFDEVWRGRDVRTDQPCSSVMRRLVASVAAGPQLENERGPSGLLSLVRLTVPVSTETLNSLRVHMPNGVRGIDSGKAVGSLVRFRAAPFRPRPAADVTENLDTRHGFDIAVSTSSAAPASRENRFVIGRDGESGEFVVEQFAWAVGDPIASNDAVRWSGVAQQGGSGLLRLESGYGTFVTLRINSLSNGSIQIVDATR
jgi:hypothetical protein